MPLRFGVMCNSTTFDHWEAQCLEQLCDVEGVEPVLLICHDPLPSSEPAKGRVRKALDLLRAPEGAWTVYRRYVVNKASDAMKKVDLAERLRDVPSIKCRPERRGNFSEYFTESDLEAIRSYRLDFVMRFGFGIIRGDVLNVPTYGVWSFHHDDLDKYRGRPPCFWEIFHNDPVTGAVLQRLTDRLDGGIVLKRGYFKTDRTSYTRNREKVYAGSVEWPAQVCRDVLNGCATYLHAEPSTTDAPIYYRPTRWQLMRFLAKTSLHYLWAALEPLFITDRWNIGVVDQPVHELLNVTELPPATWASDQGNSTFLADPYPVNESTVLAEEFDFKTNKGCITAFEAQERRFSRKGVSINGSAHLSYPFVLVQKDRSYCLPEASESGRLTLYVTSGDPVEWQPAHVLLKEPVLDPTLIEYDGRWWLFGTLASHYPETKLFLWYANHFTGPWKRHPANPVKCDVRSSRPGGKPFVYNDQLFRPAQDCSRTYGGAIAVNRVLNLSPYEFEEETVTWIRPSNDGPYPHGAHTLVGWEQKTLVDGKRRVFVPSSSFRYLSDKVSRRKNESKSFIQ